MSFRVFSSLSNIPSYSGHRVSQSSPTLHTFNQDGKHNFKKTYLPPFILSPQQREKLKHREITRLTQGHINKSQWLCQECNLDHLTTKLTLYQLQNISSASLSAHKKNVLKKKSTAIKYRKRSSSDCRHSPQFLCF